MGNNFLKIKRIQIHQGGTALKMQTKFRLPDRSWR